jgi:hypothetical protein
VVAGCRKVQNWVQPNRKSTSKAENDEEKGARPNLSTFSAFALLQFGVGLSAIITLDVLTIAESANQNRRGCAFGALYNAQRERPADSPNAQPDCCTAVY